MQEWGPLSGIAYNVVGVATLALALFVQRSAPPTSRNRWLAALLGLMGLHAVVFGQYSIQQWGIRWGPDMLEITLLVVAWVLYSFIPIVYLGLLRKTLPRRYWWNTRFTMTLMVLAALSFMVYSALNPFMWATGRVWMFGIYAGGAVSVLGLLVAIQWVLVSLRNKHERRVAFAFLVAFSIRNLQFIRDLVRAVSEDILGTAIVFGPAAWYEEWNFDLWQDVFLEGLFVVVLAFAVLSGQLVTLDNRIKASLRTGTVTLALTTVFLLLTEGVEVILGVESVALSVAGAVVLSLLVQPFHRWAEAIATRLVPGAHLIDTLPMKERRDTYLLQAKLAWADGSLTAKEVNMLNRLQQHLGLDDDTVDRLDARARSKRKGTGTARKATQ